MNLAVADSMSLKSPVMKRNRKPSQLMVALSEREMLDIQALVS